jgi:hypothetical protein
VLITFTAPGSGPSAGFPGGNYDFSDANGQVSVAIFANTVAGTYSITAAATGGSNPTTSFVNLTNIPAAASQFVLSAPPTAASGSTFDVTVTAADSYGNIDASYAGTIHFTSSDTDPGVQLPADYTFQPGDAGVAHFPGGAALITPGDQMITATDSISGITGSATITVTAGPGPFVRDLETRDDSAPVLDVPPAPIQRHHEPFWNPANWLTFVNRFRPALRTSCAPKV